MKDKINILTFDIEEWVLAKDGGYGTPELYAEYDAFLDRILTILNQQNVKASFFCTGRMAIDYPQVLRLIQSQGHEIGCHSHHHNWMNRVTESEAREDTHAAVDAIQQCIGQKVLSYRAPAFSIGERNKWMFEILANEGITRDSSVFPTSRDFGGFPNFGSQEPCIIEYNGISIKEFPIPMTKILNKTIAYSGGGFFRFLPLAFVKSRMTNSNYSLCYFHINDLLPESGTVPTREEYEIYYKETATFMKRYIRYLKNNIGKKGAWNKLEKLICTTELFNIASAETIIDWGKMPKIKL